ncbi:MAG TPA: N-acetylglucosamine-6-phosphate deacetylase [Candidatus Dormibacteraeota bacterium]|nr:N-acetylglucosamine-6-phosphate deacetylase [Candidatus Dormibacteraeota bacterium]
MSPSRQDVRGRLVLADSVVPGTIVIDDGRIAEVDVSQETAARDGGSHGEAGRADEAPLPYIAPGFVDVHVHGFGGFPAMGSAADLDGMARALLRHGVTSFLPTAVTASLDTLRGFADTVRAWIPGAPADGAAPLGFDLEGPFISPRRKGAHDPALILAPVDAPAGSIELLLDGLRVTTIAPETPGALELIGRLASAGVAVSLGHSESTLQEALAGYAAGARSTTHLFNAMSGVDHRRPGLAVAALATDAAYVELIADGHHVHPSLWPVIARAKPASRLLLVSDALPIAGTDERRTVIGGLAVEIVGSRAVLAGTDTLAGSVIALDTAVRNLVRAGFDLPFAAAAASANPLALLGVDDRGRLEPGLLADLVELDDELNVRRAWREGVEVAAA